MFYLLLSVVFAGLLVILFRLFVPYKVSLLQVVMYNYWVCVGLGLAFTPTFGTYIENWQQDWLWLAIIEGLCFVSIFFVTGLASQTLGVAYTGMITKISVIIPVMVAIIAFDDKVTFYNVIGIILALSAVILMHLKYFSKKANTSQDHIVSHKIVIALTALLFLGSGLCDSLLKVFEHLYSTTIPQEVFVIAVFGAAGFFALVALIILIILGKESLRSKNVIAGITLGVPNYFSLLFLLKGLEVIEAPVFFPINNIGILLFVGLTGFFFFKERFTLASWVGLGLACLAIFVMALERVGF